jgi:hypothetical protein
VLKKAGFVVAGTPAKDEDVLLSEMLAGPSVSFSKGLWSGTAFFHDGSLTQVAVSGDTDEAAAGLRLAELSRTYGEPTSVSRTKVSIWTSASTVAQIQVEEAIPGQKHRLEESYRPGPL